MQHTWLTSPKQLIVNFSLNDSNGLSSTIVEFLHSMKGNSWDAMLY